ncbi:hypothetical protein OIU79_002029 [Salix purpurea]|uniref:Uncharacterized protein n=1 Tax=Salix purpurea TaxID=77065 RepID=A0A9Q0URX1_SALPP|nr:hypothetical protein OIU79_002029 [Salix purpurea]
MPWFFIIFLLSCTFHNLSAEAGHGKKLPSAVVVGTVYCDTCFQQDFSRNSHFIPGASVAVECRDEKSRPSFREEVKTDEHGEFEPLHQHSISSLESKEHIYFQLVFSLSSLKNSRSCAIKNQLLKILGNSVPGKTSPASIDNPTFPPPLQDPTPPDLPPLPLLPPLPPLPGLPLLPPVPGTTKNTKSTESFESTTLPDQNAVHFPDQFAFPSPPLFPPNLIEPPPSSLIPPSPSFTSSRPRNPPSLFIFEENFSLMEHYLAMPLYNFE